VLCDNNNYNRKDANKSALMHVTNFTLLKLSGERNFGVSLNKPYTGQLHPDLPPIRGTHCDLIMLVLHKVSSLILMCKQHIRVVCTWSLVHVSIRYTWLLLGADNAHSACSACS
jgi:Dyggve-Melchior-Clausen syndrome protein